MVAQMKKGVLEFCILHVVSGQELYGYEIMKRLASVFSDTNESTIYAILRRLLLDRYTECYSKEESGGPPRKYYRITPEGRTYLAKLLSDWEYIAGGVAQILAENG